MRSFVLAAAAATLPLAVAAHGFDERHDLPAPLAHFAVGAAAAVALSFVLAVLFARRAPAAPGNEHATPRAAMRVPAPVRLALRLASLLLFAVTVAAALFGTADPTMNLAPTLVWIGWWVGLSLLVACIGDVWPLLDPWATLFDAADAVARRMGRHNGIAMHRTWPPALGAWPAVALLLAWSWFEVVYPLAAVPHRLGVAALAWTALTLLGMVCFGREQWQRNGDVFAICFELLGRMAPIGWPRQGRALPAGGVAFVIAMLSTVLFDGLHAGQGWPWFEGVLSGLGLKDHEGLIAGTAGLLLVWLALLAAYAGSSWIGARMTGAASAATVARGFALTLVPIAVGYNVAHNFSSLVEQGQNLLPLLSDPFGRGWNLFGTAQLHTRSGLVDARMTWQVAIATVVAGHCAGVWLAHRVALRDHPQPAQAVRAALPLVVLMLAYTAISLFVIADPITRYQPH